MTVATFESKDGPIERQALECFRQLRDFLDNLGTELVAAGSLVIEVNDRHNLAPVQQSRRQIFGDQKPRYLSRRLVRLPPGELVRITVNTDRSGTYRQAIG